MEYHRSASYIGNAINTVIIRKMMTSIVLPLRVPRVASSPRKITVKMTTRIGCTTLIATATLTTHSLYCHELF